MAVLWETNLLNHKTMEKNFSEMFKRPKRKLKGVVVAIGLLSISQWSYGQCNAPVVATSGVCAGNTKSLTPSNLQSGATYEWYTAPSGGTLLYTGNTYTTPALTTTTSYYVSARTSSCTSPRTQVNVVVNPLPNPTITTPASVCSGAEFTITYNYGGGNTFSYIRPATWVNVNTSGASGAFAEVGKITSSGTASLTATTSLGCSKTVTSNILIPSLPVVANRTICAGNSVTLTPSPLQTGVVYDWYNQASGGTLLFTGNSYTTPVLTTSTSYWVVARISGCTSARTQVNVTVNPLPSPTITAPATVCGGAEFNVTYFYGTGNTFTSSTKPATWVHISSTGGPSGSGENGTITATGAFTLTVTSAAGCSKTVSSNVTVNSTMPNPNLTVPATACVGDHINIIYNYGVGNTYVLTKPSTYTTLTGGVGPVPGSIGESGIITGSGTFNLSVTSPGGCSKTTTKTITVSPKPATPTITAPYESICHGENLQMTGSPTGGTWSVSPFGAVISSTGLFSTSTAGLYTATYQVTNGVCSLTATKTIKVGALPFTILGPNQICTGQEYTYTIEEEATGNLYTWRRDGNTTSYMATNSPLTANLLAGGVETSPILLTAQGEFTCTDGTKRSNVVTKQVTYAARPNLLIKCADATCNLLTVANASGLTLNWYYTNSAGTVVSLGTGTTVTNPKASTIISLEASNGTCPTTFFWTPKYHYPCDVLFDNDKPLNPAQGYGSSARMATNNDVDNTTANGYSLMVRPNPASSAIFFESDGAEGDAKIFDNQGTVLKTIKLAANQKSYNVSLDGLTAGMYYLQVYSGSGKVYATAIVKE